MRETYGAALATYQAQAAADDEIRAALQLIARAATRVTLAKGETLFTAGTPGAAVFAQESLAPSENLTVVVAIPDPDGDSVEPSPILIDQHSSMAVLVQPPVGEVL